MQAPKTIVVAGIDTDAGKTIVASALVHKLKADYWKPVQAGDLANSDSIKVTNYTVGVNRQIHTEAYRLTQPMSPHQAAKIDGIEIDELTIPKTDNHLIIELAGGLMVPLSDSCHSLDWLKKIGFPVVLVSRYYLGQINHTLLSISALRRYDVELLGVVFSGEENLASKQAILTLGNTVELGHIQHLEEVGEKTIKKAAQNIELERSHSI